MGAVELPSNSPPLHYLHLCINQTLKGNCNNYKNEGDCSNYTNDRRRLQQLDKELKDIAIALYLIAIALYLIVF